MSQGSGLRIQSGKWKGRSIPIPPKIKGNSHFTPAILKKSVFSILDSLQMEGRLNFSRTVFVDLFAGSGQMGAEALSRGFAKSIFVEMATERFSSLLELAKMLGQDAILHKKDSLRLDEKLYSQLDIDSVVYYVDPPYVLWTQGCEKIHSIIAGIIGHSAIPTFILLQGPSKPKIDEWDSREFGSNLLYTILP